MLVAKPYSIAFFNMYTDLFRNQNIFLKELTKGYNWGKIS